MPSSRSKEFLRRTTPKKKDQVLEAADDFQAAGVDYEDAAGKWRKGDPVKSLRFFQRAIEVYEQGLQKYPRSLDLAYNRARVELEVATHPLLSSQLQIPLIDALRQALKSHQFALGLQEDNADTLFNTAQVLTSIAEEVAKDEDLSDEEAFQCLEQALELQDRCLKAQEQSYEEYHQQIQTLANNDPEDEDDDGGARIISESSPTTNQNNQETQWATVVEPITASTLIDTALSKLSTLTALCSLLSNNKDTRSPALLPIIEQQATVILQDKIPKYVHLFENEQQSTTEAASDETPDETLHEIALSKAQFLTHFLETQYLSNAIDIQTFMKNRNEAFNTTTNPHLNLTTTYDSQLANANSLVALSTALLSTTNTSSAGSETGDILWTTLSTALTQLTSASKLSGSPAIPSTATNSTILTITPAPEQINVSETHLLRGNVSLMLNRLSLTPFHLPKALKGADQLLKNARVYYANAVKLAHAEDMETRRNAMFRGRVVDLVMQCAGDEGNDAFKDKLAGLVKDERTGNVSNWKRLQVEEMLEDGLIVV